MLSAEKRKSLEEEVLKAFVVRGTEVIKQNSTDVDLSKFDWKFEEFDHTPQAFVSEYGRLRIVMEIGPAEFSLFPIVIKVVDGFGEMYFACRLDEVYAK